jgi:starvation-inducible outer membrane lipoprotein
VNVKILFGAIMLIGTVCFSGCSSMPSGVAMERQAQEEEASEAKSEAFAKSLPPAR